MSELDTTTVEGNRGTRKTSEDAHITSGASRSCSFAPLREGEPLP